MQLKKSMGHKKVRNYDPEYITYKGEKYYINTDYRYAMRCMQLIGDRNVSDLERSLGLVYILFGVIPEDNEMLRYFLEKTKVYLQCGETNETHLSRKKDMDFLYDFKYIEASFQSDYGIDLSIENMSWWRFMRLLEGLTEDSVLSRVRYIRNYDVNEIKDPKFKNEMQRAQKDLRLPSEDEQYTDEEQAQIDKFNSLFE